MVVILWAADAVVQGTTGSATELAGWFTAAGAGGSTAILIIVLRWIFWTHLPDKDKQIASMIEAQDKRIQVKDTQIESILQVKNEQLKMLTLSGAEQVKAMITSANDERKLMHEQNQRALEQVIQHCKEEMTTTNELFRRDFNEFGELIQELTEEIREMRGMKPRKYDRPQGPQNPPKPAG